MLSLVVDYRPGNEFAFAAARVADILAICETPFRLLSTTPPATGVHPLWDREVGRFSSWRPSKGLGVVAFGVPLSPARCVIYVARASDPPELTKQFPYCVFPCLSLAVASGRKGRCGSIFWDIGRDISVKPVGGALPSPTVAVWLDSASAVLMRGRLGEALSLLSTAVPDLHIRLLRFGSVCRDDRAAIRALATTGRVADQPINHVGDALAVLAASHAIVAPEAIGCLGMPAAFAAACQLPIVAFAVQPYCEQIGMSAWGVAVPPRDAGAGLCRAIASVLTPEAQRCSAEWYGAQQPGGRMAAASCEFWTALLG